MDELLQKLLEKEILTPESQEELRTAFDDQVKAASDAAADAARIEVTAELTESFVAEKEQLIEAIDQKVTDMFANEIGELQEDFEAYKDLEADYAEKLVEAKASLADEVQVDLAKLVDELDAFVEVQLAEEVSELREDIEASRKDQFGRKIFEAMADEFRDNFHSEDDTTETISSMATDLEDATAKLEEAESKVAEYERNEKMTSLLSPLSGTQKEMMETILKNVPTPRLDETYETFIGRVVRKTDDNTEKEDGTVLSESSEVNGEKDTESEVLAEDLVVVTGDTGEQTETKVELTETAKAQIAHARQIAGLTE